MTEKELFLEGVNLMISGMGFVMVFLLLLIGAIDTISEFINRFLSRTELQPEQLKSTTAATEDDLERLRPVIVAAIAHYRRSKGLS